MPDFYYRCLCICRISSYWPIPGRGIQSMGRAQRREGENCTYKYLWMPLTYISSLIYSDSRGPSIIQKSMEEWTPTKSSCHQELVKFHSCLYYSSKDNVCRACQTTKNKGLKQKNGFVKSKYKPACEDKENKH